jgi:4-deoxy-L-threo-5-hexosulose-uronate ketol-isomerase
MDQRYATHPTQIPMMDTAELREQFLVQDLFVSGEITATYTHHDRMVVGGVAPAGAEIALPTYDELRTEHFLDLREIGIMNIGEAGTITADGESFEMPKDAVLYVGRGTKSVTFAGEGAKFYFISAPAHMTYPTVRVLAEEANTLVLGDITTSNSRTIRQYIHLNGARSCQLVMGATSLNEGSMWNTMPAHTHDRRTEIYLYFALPADQRVVHIMGEPTESRHLIMANEEAVISPSWSLHTGVGTAAYSFIWAMAGENQEFTDMDPCPISEIL